MQTRSGQGSRVRDLLRWDSSDGAHMHVNCFSSQEGGMVDALADKTTVAASKCCLKPW